MRSDVGMRRTNNQDSVETVPAADEDTARRRGHLFVVADGMGAHAAGELASQMATERIAQHYVRLTSVGQARPIDEAVAASVVTANADIHARGRGNPEFHNMGTTASVLVLSPGGGTVAHVGDSRVYQVSGDRIVQWTFDHSLVWEMEAGGQLNDANRHTIPSNVITRSLGPSAEVRVDVEGPIDWKPGDRFVLCSDGLNAVVDDAEIGRLVASLDVATAVDALVDLANLRGGPDNVSVIVVQAGTAAAGWSGGAGSASTGRLGRGRSGDNKGRLALLAGLSFGAVAIAVAFFVAGLVVPGIVALTLAVLTVVMAAVGRPKRGATALAPGTSTGSGSIAGSGPAAGSVTGSGPVAGSGPHRAYTCTPADKMCDELDATVGQIRQAATEKGWDIDWAAMDAVGRGCDEFTASANRLIAVVDRLKTLRNR